MTSDTRRQESLRILRTLRDAGFESYWAGGCVRDLLLGRPPKDYDIATAATPGQIQSLFSHTIPVGAAFGVILVVETGSHEVATFRRDLGYRDGRRPEAVAFCGAEEDARRRDFTINGLFYDPDQDRVLDFVKGREDLSRKLVRAIGDPRARFKEDHLRMLRAARLAATLEFEIDAATREAIHAEAGQLSHIAAERIQQELSRLLLEAPRAGQGLLLLRDLGLLHVILPEVARLDGQQQPPQYHPEGDVLTHTALMLDQMGGRDPTLVYAVLLHDVGKPATAQWTTEPDGGQRLRFNNHARVGAEMAEQILRRLRFPARVIEDVVHCVANHMRFMDVPKMRRATIRRMMGAPTFASELELHRLDCLASHGDLSNYEQLKTAQAELAAEPVLPAPWISGRDIMSMGIPEGPEVGAWRRTAYERQLEGQAASREELVAWLKAKISQDRP